MREQRFQLLMEAAFDYALFFMAPDGSIRDWSLSATRLIGYTEAEARRLNADIIFTAEDKARRTPEWEMATAAREGQANDERWHVRKDGSRFFAIGRLVALRSRDGALVGYAKIIRDATPHRLLEQALRASDAHFRACFAQAPIGMTLSDLEGRIQQVNAAFAGLLGWTDGAVEGRRLIELTAEEDRAEAARRLDQLFAGQGDFVMMEKRMVRSDGSRVWVQNSAAILRDAEGRPLSVIDLVQDISLLKLTETELGLIVEQRTSALAQKTKQMEAFCYTVAHDLRAPLRAIAGYADFLRQDFSPRLPPEGLDYLSRIEASAARLDRLISDLLGYTRMQQVPVLLEAIDLTAVTRRVVDQVRRDNPGVQVAVEIVEPLGAARADLVTVEHVLLNLLSNAVKFRREEEPPRIKIWSEGVDKRQRVWVEDNGIGLDPRFKDRVFGMFERLHPERNIPGTGVGLAIVATAMERLGGSRGVEPNHPFGCRFWIELPR